MDCRSRGFVSRFGSETQRERCALQVGVILTPRMRLKKGFELNAYFTKGAPFFSGSPLLSASEGEVRWNGLWWFMRPVDDTLSHSW